MFVQLARVVVLLSRGDDVVLLVTTTEPLVDPDPGFNGCPVQPYHPFKFVLEVPELAVCALVSHGQT